MPYVLHQLLTESANRHPDSEAVRLLDQALTYKELEKLSNQVAHLLIANGVRPGDRVGIYLKKSPAAIASIFGIMKTGACYVPVDANAPGMRLLRARPVKAAQVLESLIRHAGVPRREAAQLIPGLPGRKISPVASESSRQVAKDLDVIAGLARWVEGRSSQAANEWRSCARSP